MSNKSRHTGSLSLGPILNVKEAFNILGAIRTRGLSLRRRPLYPAELRGLGSQSLPYQPNFREISRLGALHDGIRTGKCLEKRDDTS